MRKYLIALLALLAVYFPALAQTYPPVVASQVFGGTGPTSTLTLGSTTFASNISNTDGINVLTSNGLTINLNTTTGVGGNPWEFLGVNTKLDTWGHIFVTGGSAQTSPDGFGCNNPYGTPNQPATTAIISSLCATENGKTANVTFTNGSPVIAWVGNGASAGTLVSFYTTGTLPSGFSVGASYCVIATGLGANQVEVSATCGGGAITAGSAGTGTQSIAANISGVTQYSNELSVQDFVLVPGLDINAGAFTTSSYVDGSGGSGVIGVGHAWRANAVAYGAEIAANCHTGGIPCTQNIALQLECGGDTTSQCTAYLNMFSGAAGDSPLHAIRFGYGPTTNPVQGLGTGSTLIDVAGSWVQADYGIHLVGMTLGINAYDSPGFSVSAAGVGAFGNPTAGQQGKIFLLGATSGTATLAASATGGFLGLNDLAADSLLTVNANTGSTVAPRTGTNLHVTGADTATNTLSLDSFGGLNAISSRRSDGTRASKTALATSDALASFTGEGYDGTAYTSGGAVAINFTASQTWTNAAHGTYINMFTVPNGTTTLTEAMRIQNSGGVSIGTTTDPGIGNLLANVAVQSPKLTLIGSGSGTVSLTPSATGGLLGVNDTAPDSLLTVNANSGTTVAPVAGTNLHVTGADSAVNNVLLDAFGTAGTNFNQISCRYAGGTRASKTAAANGATICSFQMYGWDGSTYASQGIVNFNTSQLWAPGAHGLTSIFYTTPNGTTSPAISLQLQNSGGVTIGASGTDPGIGGLQVGTQVFVPNITTTSVAQTGTVCWTTGTGKFTVDTTVACLASSERFKNVIGAVSPQEALDITSKLRPVRFTRKAEFGGDADPSEQFGLSAEQAASVDERLIARDDSGLPKGVRYMEFTSVLAGAIQALKGEIDELKRTK